MGAQIDICKAVGLLFANRSLGKELLHYIKTINSMIRNLWYYDEINLFIVKNNRVIVKTNGNTTEAIFPLSKTIVFPPQLSSLAAGLCF